MNRIPHYIEGKDHRKVKDVSCSAREIIVALSWESHSSVASSSWVLFDKKVSPSFPGGQKGSITMWAGMQIPRPACSEPFLLKIYIYSAELDQRHALCSVSTSLAVCCLPPAGSVLLGVGVALC